jgi:hypothetical protein
MVISNEMLGSLRDFWFAGEKLRRRRFEVCRKVKKNL